MYHNMVLEVLTLSDVKRCPRPAVWLARPYSKYSREGDAFSLDRVPILLNLVPFPLNTCLLLERTLTSCFPPSIKIIASGK
eukprot:SAG31_NODE_29479_length_394_cov_1.430508_1_plen_80_part_10